MSDEQLSTKEVYNKYKEKYNLPEFEKVCKFLEISDLEDDCLTIINLRKRVIDKAHKFIEILDPIVQPDSTIISMYENSFLDDIERQNCFKLYKSLMVITKEADLLSIDENDDETGIFIKNTITKLNEIKEEIKAIVTKQKETWQKNDDLAEKALGYFG